MDNFALVLTLGHNSSAVAIRNGLVVCGYEEERFTLKKSDSAYPRNAINRCLEIAKLPFNTPVFIGHWFLDGQLPTESNKYLDYEHLYQCFPDTVITAVSDTFTHHDSHLVSGIVFADQEGGLADDYMAFVLDGFGTHGEVISVYNVINGGYELVDRWFGFEKSLGMFYQYATAYIGMQMHNHEYKILAYEVHIFDNVILEALEPQIESLADLWAHDWNENLAATINAPFDPMLTVTALPNVQDKFNQDFDNVLLQLGFSEIDEYTKRVVISRFVQKCVEKCIMHLFHRYTPKNLLVAGGLFYNVKINSLLANAVEERFCAMPLAGDQGAGLGVYQAYNGDLTWPGHLNWGIRNLDPGSMELPPGILVFDNEHEALAFARKEIDWHGFVNIVRGAMEFGPRALCHTSTIAIPTRDITSKINDINSRTNEMPMAPVMTQAQANQFFEDTLHVHMSLDYMIVTRDYKPELANSVLGAAHFYKDRDVYTGRPQITADPFMVALLNEFGPLVNTSFNYHGVPIVFELDSIINTHNEQRKHSEQPIYTVIIKE